MRGRYAGAAALAALLSGPVSMAAAPPAVSVDVRALALQPGEPMVVTVEVGRTATAVDVVLFGRVVPAYETAADRWTALVGIDLNQRPGEYPLTATAHFQPEGPAAAVAAAETTVEVGAKKFRTRTLSVRPDFVNPPPAVLARIEEETALVDAAYSRSAAGRLWDLPFVRPVPQAANSAFGTRSVFNGQPRSPHAGTDFLSPAGTPIQAPNAGRVVVARDLFFSGNTVIIDHGLGLFSMLAHLSRIDVHEGDAIDRSAIVGLVGATGRVTGPHLHWAVRLNGARVNGLSLLTLLGPAAARP
jgi:murein DD-endopeptidase MepM/ murein hydrolase activator NlpD